MNDAPASPGEGDGAGGARQAASLHEESDLPEGSQHAAPPDELADPQGKGQRTASPRSDTPHATDRSQHTLGLIVVAAGRGERYGGDKVWEPLAGQPLVARSLLALAGPPVECVALVVAPAHLSEGRALARTVPVRCVVVPGGARRQDSVRNGLLALGPCEWVAVHDAARPFATHELLVRTLAAAQATGAAVPAVPIADTVKRVHEGMVVETVPRAGLWAVQTPQVFRGALLAQAHRATVDDATDDATLVERLGARVAVADGAYNNVKITTPEDMDLAAWRVRSSEY